MIEELDPIRISLNNHVGYINLFITSVSSDSLYRIETVLEDLVKEVRSGRRAPTRYRCTRRTTSTSGAS